MMKNHDTTSILEVVSMVLFCNAAFFLALLVALLEYSGLMYLVTLTFPVEFWRLYACFLLFAGNLVLWMAARSILEEVKRDKKL